MDRYLLSAYIILPKKEVYVEVKECCCSNCSRHKVDDTDRFCRDCGAKVDEITKLEIKTMKVSDLVGLGRLNQYLYYSGVSVLTSCIVKGILGDDDHNLIPITKEYIDVQVGMFLNEHADDIKKIEEAFGCKVNVEYGFINFEDYAEV